LDTDVVIVGLSTAGAATALQLANAGHEVVILDRDEHATRGVAGGVLHAIGARELNALGAADLPDLFGAQALETVRLSEGAGRVVTSSFQGSVAYGLRRSRVTAWLAERCAEHPRIQVRDGVGVLAVGVSKSQVIVETDEGDLWARAVVGADGAASKVREELGLTASVRSAPRLAIEAHFSLPMGFAADATMDVAGAGDGVFRVIQTGKRDVDIVLWLADSAHAEVDADAEHAFYRRLECCAAITSRLEGARAKGPVAPRLFSTERPPKIVDGRAVLVGHAAGPQLTLAGLTLSAALIGARLAAVALSAALHADDLSAQRLSAYPSALQAALRDSERVATVLDDAMRAAGPRARLLKLLAQHPDTFTRLLLPFGGARLADVLGAADYWRLYNR